MVFVELVQHIKNCQYDAIEISWEPARSRFKHQFCYLLIMGQ